jgi:DNA-binding NarL/FixJ family response regulator
LKEAKIIIVDDHQLVRDGIKSLISTAKNIEICGEASSAAELFEIITTVDANLVILDISLPDMSGIEITKKIIKEYPGINVLILSMHVNEEFVFNAIKAGAKGYLPKNTTRKELLEAIYTIIRDEEYFSEQISNLILKSYIKKAKQGNKPGEQKETLSGRETEILKLVAEGASNKEISEKLFISIRTVESHKNHIMQKLELKSVVDLVKYAIRNKIIEI